MQHLNHVGKKENSICGLCMFMCMQTLMVIQNVYCITRMEISN